MLFVWILKINKKHFNTKKVKWTNYINLWWEKGCIIIFSFRQNLISFWENGRCIKSLNGNKLLGVAERYGVYGHKLYVKLSTVFLSNPNVTLVLWPCQEDMVLSMWRCYWQCYCSGLLSIQVTHCKLGLMLLLRPVLFHHEKHHRCTCNLMVRWLRWKPGETTSLMVIVNWLGVNMEPFLKQSPRSQN